MLNLTQAAQQLPVARVPVQNVVHVQQPNVAHALPLNAVPVRQQSVAHVRPPKQRLAALAQRKKLIVVHLPTNATLAALKNKRLH